MRIVHVRLRVAEEKALAVERFYGDQLGLPAAGGALRVGATELEFSPVESADPFYHYAFRVPRNRFAAARDWFAGHTALLTEAGSSETTFDFANWNAEACYGHDPAGNIVELIAHHDLPEESTAGGEFGGTELLGICELGVVGLDTRAMAAALEPLGIVLWDGTLDEPGRLAFLGDRDGLLILTPDGRGWLPTGRPAEATHAVDAVVTGVGHGDAALPGTPHRIRAAAES
jgi:catechol 2,3-dioxygenase-like lactoylglutathione lyase family enzyme